MSILLASDLGLTVLQGVLAATGILVFLVWLAFRVRGRNLLPRGPEPVAAFRPVDGALILVAWLAVQMTALSVAGLVGLGPGANLSMMSKVGELLVVVVALLAWLSKSPAHGSRPAGALAGALCCLAFLPVVWGVLVAWYEGYQAAGGVWEEQQILVDLREAAPWKFVLLAVVLAPVTEEVIFRGVIHLTVKKLAGRWTGILVSAVFFTLVHWSLPVGPAIFILGVALALVYERTGTLAAPIAFHAVFNGITVAGELLRQTG